MVDSGKKCSERIVGDLYSLGVRPGDTMLVHSSFKSLGYVPGGIETLIQGFLLLLGSSGTLLLPALVWGQPDDAIFDLNKTPTVLGAVPEYFRRRPGTVRSMHPTHSVCAVGARVEELLGSHLQDSTPCGPNSPFHKITAQDVDNTSWILMLGCGLGPNTTMHALEELVNPPYLLSAPQTYLLRDSDGKVLSKHYFPHSFAGYHQRYERVALLEQAADIVRKGIVLQAETFLIRAYLLREAVVRKLEEEPLFFVEKA